jgi:hypothetical protein
MSAAYARLMLAKPHTMAAHARTVDANRREERRTEKTSCNIDFL